MLRKIAINIGSGYAQKVVQTICGLITVPILLSDSGLGFSGYGELAVALSISALVSTMYDGFRLTASRRIGLSKSDFRSETYRLTLWILIVTLPAAIILVTFSTGIYALAGLTETSENLIYLIVSSLLIEQASYVIEQSYHAQLKTAFVNTLSSFEVLARMIAIWVIFSDGKQTIDTYFEIVIFTSAFKLIAMMLTTVRHQVSDRTFIPTGFSTYVRESISISLNGISITLVFRISIILANKLFSSEMAAVFSITFLTIRNYLNQLFVSVIRPMVIPLASRFDLKNGHHERRYLYNNAIALYEVLVTTSTIFLAASITLWLPAWLGDHLNTYFSIIALAIIAIGLECALSLKSMTLFSQGSGRQVTASNTAWSIIYFTALWMLYILGLLSLSSLSISTCMYLFFCNGLSINFIYARKIHTIKSSIITTLSSVVSALLIYSIMSDDADPTAQIVLLLMTWATITTYLLIANASLVRETWRHCQIKSS
jgi:O-antigen/teichoic acid export membrane protein